MAEATPRAGILGSIRGLLGTALTLLQTRAELFITELEEETLRLRALLLWGAIALFAVGIGLVFLAVFLTVLFWESNRLLVLGVFTGIFVSGAVVALFMVSRLASRPSAMFSSSLAELARDRAALRQDQ